MRNYKWIEDRLLKEGAMATILKIPGLRKKDMLSLRGTEAKVFWTIILKFPLMA